MGIQVTCPTCGKPGIAPDNAIGRKVRCRGCQSEFQIAATPPPKRAPPRIRIVAETAPAAALPDMADLALRVRVLEFLQRPLPADLGDHSLGYGLIRAYWENDPAKIRDPNYLKTLSVFAVLLRLEGKGGSPERQAYVAEESELLQEIKGELQG